VSAIALLGGIGLALAVSLLATLLCERLARRAGVVAVIRDDRWHRAPVPLLGGAAIAATTVGLLFAAGGGVRLITLGLAALAMALVGLVDDLRALPPALKLVLEVAVAAALVQFGFLLRLTAVPVLDILITLFWLVGITNAFNLLDNMDGLSSTIALIAAGFRLLFFVWDRDASGAMATAVFLGAVAGFLVRNFPPAKIFMGDSGSLFLGFFLAGLSLVPAWQAYSRGLFAVLVIPVTLLMIPIFDTTFVTVTRLLSGRGIAVGGRDHTSHRLVAVGLSERQTLVCLGTIAALAGTVAAASYRYGLSRTVVLVAALVVAITLLGIYLSRVRVVSDREQAPGGVVRLIADFMYKRQLATVVVDLVLVVIAYYGAYLLRFEATFDDQTGVLARSMPIVLVAQLAALWVFGMHRQVWQYTGVRDLTQIVRAVTVGTLATVIALVFFYRFEGYSRSVFVIYWVLAVLVIGASRLSFRLFGEMFRTPPPSSQRVLVWGAGGGGEMLVRALLANPELGRVPVGFIDDDRAKHQRRIHGVAVLGGRERAADIVRDTGAREIIVSTHSIEPRTVEQLTHACRDLPVVVRRAAVHFE
jgi:UDP-GlcNAc:undecaprenyl-phosphate/decaprenyl-phosphate GlcNAc-1-phosphate transferase